MDFSFWFLPFIFQFLKIMVFNQWIIGRWSKIDQRLVVNSNVKFIFVEALSRELEAFRFLRAVKNNKSFWPCPRPTPDTGRADAQSAKLREFFKIARQWPDARAMTWTSEESRSNMFVRNGQLWWSSDGQWVSWSHSVSMCSYIGQSPRVVLLFLLGALSSLD
jgi:hypothetical protein